MFDLSPEKIFLVAIIALVVLGPNRLPQAARSFGRFVAQLRKMSASFQAEVRDAMGEPVDAINSVVGTLRPAEMRRNVRQAVSTTLSPQPGKEGEAPPPPSTVPNAPDDPTLN